MNSAIQILRQGELVPGDYVSPGLVSIKPDAAFPNMAIGDVTSSTWPYLRREITHNWYVDARNPTVGFLSRDEAAILYNSALMFKGKPALEIGCWRGWSTAHCAAAIGTLDVIDPVLTDETFFLDVRSSLDRAGVLDAIAFYPDSSPDAVEKVAAASAKRWSFVFIDGDHEGDAPRKDAEVVSRFAAANALVLFHDLASPSVAAGLDYLRAEGWHTMIYQTMQIMGVAWRGEVAPILHLPDDNQRWSLPDHLQTYPVSGQGQLVTSPTGENYDFVKNLRETFALDLSAAQAESARLASLVDGLGQKLSTFNSELTELHSTREALSARCVQMEAQRKADQGIILQLQAERDLLSGLMDRLQGRLLESGARLAEADMRGKTLEEQISKKNQEANERKRLLAEQADELSRNARLQAKHKEILDRVAMMDEARVAGPAAPQVRPSGLREFVTVVRLRREKALSCLSDLAACSGKYKLYLESYQAAPVLADYIGGSRVLLGLFRRRLFAGAEAPRTQVRRIFEGFGNPISLEVADCFASWFSNERDLFGLVRRLLMGRGTEVKTLILWKLNECLSRELTGSLPQIDPLIEMYSSQSDADAELLKLIENEDLDWHEVHNRDYSADVRAEVEKLRSQNQLLEKRYRELEAAKILDENALLSAEIEVAASRMDSHLPVGSQNGSENGSRVKVGDGRRAQGAAI